MDCATVSHCVPSNVPIGRSNWLNSKVWTVMLSFSADCQTQSKVMNLYNLLKSCQITSHLGMFLTQFSLLCIWRFWTQPSHGPSDFVRISVSRSWQAKARESCVWMIRNLNGITLGIVVLKMTLWLLQDVIPFLFRRQDFLDLMHQMGEALGLQPLMVKDSAWYGHLKSHKNGFRMFKRKFSEVSYGEPWE